MEKRGVDNSRLFTAQENRRHCPSGAGHWQRRSLDGGSQSRGSQGLSSTKRFITNLAPDVVIVDLDGDFELAGASGYRR